MKEKIQSYFIGLFIFLLIISSAYIISYFKEIKNNYLLYLLLFELVVNIYVIKTIIKNIKPEKNKYSQNILK